MDIVANYGHRIILNVVFVCRLNFCFNINLSPRRNSTGSCGQWQKLQPAVPSKNYPVTEIIVVFYHRFVRHKGINLKCVVYLSLLFLGYPGLWYGLNITRTRSVGKKN
jgi:hypothetical protein